MVWDSAIRSERKSRVVFLHYNNIHTGLRVVPTRALTSPFLLVNRESRSRALKAYSAEIPVYGVAVPRTEFISEAGFALARKLVRRHGRGGNISTSIPVEYSKFNMSAIGEFTFYEAYVRQEASMTARGVIRGMSDSISKGIVRISPKHDLFVFDETNSELSPFIGHQKAMTIDPTIDPQAPRCHMTAVIDGDVSATFCQVLYVDDGTQHLRSKSEKRFFCSWLRSILPGIQGLWYIDYYPVDRRKSFSCIIDSEWARGRGRKVLRRMKMKNLSTSIQVPFVEIHGGNEHKWV